MSSCRCIKHHILKRKLHSSIIIPDLAGMCCRVWWWKSEVKFQLGPRSIRSKMAKESWVTKTRPVLHHWSQASRIRCCGMVFNSNGRNAFTTAGRLRPGFEFVGSLALRLARANLQNCKVAPLTSQTLARAVFAVCLTVLPLDLQPGLRHRNQQKSFR